MWKRAPLFLPLGVLGAALLGYHVLVPWPVGLAHRNPGSTSFIEYRLDQAAAEGRSLEIDQRWVPLDRISPHLKRAVLVAEDHRFREHRGVDWQALAEELHFQGHGEFSLLDPRDLAGLWRAGRYYMEHRTRVRGRSTITQQLAKNLYFTPERSLVRKLRELAVAQRLEWFLDKDRILELYLNTAEWGPGIFGAEAASRRHFGRPAADLSLEQAAALAATLPHPLTSNPSRAPARMRWRQALILERLRSGERGVLPEAPPPLEAPPLEPEPPDTVPPPDSARAEGAGADTGPPEPTPPPDTACCERDA